MTLLCRQCNYHSYFINLFVNFAYKKNVGYILAMVQNNDHRKKTKNVRVHLIAVLCSAFFYFNLSETFRRKTANNSRSVSERRSAPWSGITADISPAHDASMNAGESSHHYTSHVPTHSFTTPSHFIHSSHRVHLKLELYWYYWALLAKWWWWCNCNVHVM